MSEYKYQDLPPVYKGDENFIFISFPHKSCDIVYDDLWELHNSGVRFWYDLDIERGTNWETNVKPMIDKAAVVLIYVDKYTFLSSACEKEIAYIEQIGKKYIPIYHNGLTINKIRGSALMEEDIPESREALYGRVFHKDIVAIVHYGDNDAYYCEVKDFLAPHGVSSKELAVERNKKRAKKILVLAKDSSFSRSVIDGINDSMKCSDEYVSETIYVNDPNNEIVSDLIGDKLQENINNYDIFVVRANKEVSPHLFDVIYKYSDSREIILFDIDFNDDQKQQYEGKKKPLFICSDFTYGGEILAKNMVESFYRFGRSNTKIISCLGPLAQPSVKKRCDALEKMLKRYIPGDNLAFFSLESLNTKTETDKIVRYINSLNLFGYENLILFAGNDAIADDLIRRYQTNPNLFDCKFRNIIFAGYDGIKNSNTNQYLLENHGVNFISVDASPFSQGKEIVALIMRKNSKDGLLKPSLISSISIKQKSINSLNKFKFLKEKKIALIDLDGTIADTETYHWKAYNALLKKYNVELSPEDISRYIGHKEIDIYDMIREDFHIDFDTDSFLKERLEMYIKLVKEESLQPFGWVKEFINLADGVTPFLVTSQVPCIIEQLMLYWGLDCYISKDHIISASNKSISKEYVYRHLDEFIDVQGIDPIDVVTFEDSDFMFKIANELGFTSIGIVHQYSKNKMPHAEFLYDASYKNGLFIGLANLDIIYKMSEFNLVEDGKIKVSDFDYKIGGPAANAALTYAGLCGNATLVTAIGNSKITTVLKDELYKKNIYIVSANVYGDNNNPNVSCVLLNYTNSSRTIISGQNNIVDFELIKEIIDRDDYDFCLYDSNFVDYSVKLIDYLKAKHIPVVLDCGTIKKNIFYGIENGDIAICSSAFNEYFEENKKAMFAVTNGPKPLVFYDEETTKKEISITPVNNANTLGAGDIFHGAFCYYKFNKAFNFEEALRAASLFVFNVLKQSQK